MKKIGLLLGIVLICTGIFGCMHHATGIDRKGEGLIRFHVLSNSDSPEDQLLKLNVRDKVIDSLNKYLGESQSIDETREILNKNLIHIEETARREIQRQGSNYDVKVYLEEHIFPTRKYGNVIFPAGRYEALRVVIGEGRGQNWWCVMFPPLCFVDVKSGLTDERTRQELKRVLSDEEFAMVYTAIENEEELPLQLRSKIVDWLRGSKKSLHRLVAWF